jgi:hypothetical protein
LVAAVAGARRFCAARRGVEQDIGAGIISLTSAVGSGVSLVPSFGGAAFWVPKTARQFRPARMLARLEKEFPKEVIDESGVDARPPTGPAASAVLQQIFADHLDTGLVHAALTGLKACRRLAVSCGHVRRYS